MFELITLEQILITIIAVIWIAGAYVTHLLISLHFIITKYKHASKTLISIIYLFWPIVVVSVLFKRV